MPDPMVSLTVPSADVPILRAMVLRDFSGFAEAGSEEERELAEESAALLDSLGWDKPATGDRELSSRERFLRGTLQGFAEGALGDIDANPDAEERRDALRRLKCCVGLLEQLEEA
jgi:hypothetical protein